MRPDRVLAFEIDGPPVPCARARVYVDRKTGSVRGVTPTTTRAYKETVRWHAIRAAAAAAWRPDAEARYAFSLHVYRKRDVGDADNYAKGIADAMRGVAWIDDRHVHAMHVLLFLDPARPRVTIEVREIASSNTISKAGAS